MADRPSPSHLSAAEYARHRGCSRQSVAEAIQAGRLSAGSFVVDASGRRWIDPLRADQEWAAKTDSSQVRTPAARAVLALPAPSATVPTVPPQAGSAASSEAVDYLLERALRERAERQRAELDLARARGELVDRSRVELAAAAAGRLLQSALLALPARLADPLAALADPKAVEARLDAEIRRALEDAQRLSVADLERTLQEPSSGRA